MKTSQVLSSGAAFCAVTILCSPVMAVDFIQLGESGKTYASSAVSCAVNPENERLPLIEEVGLYKPKGKASADVSRNDVFVKTVTTDDPFVEVWLEYGINDIVVTVNRHTIDTYTYSVPIGVVIFLILPAISSAPTVHWNMRPAANLMQQ